MTNNFYINTQRGVELNCKHGELNFFGSSVGCFKKEVADDIEREEGRVERGLNTPYEFTDEESDRGLQYSQDIPPFSERKPLGAGYVLVRIERCKDCSYREFISEK